jgi:hypothetical protein
MGVVFFFIALAIVLLGAGLIALSAALGSTSLAVLFGVLLIVSLLLMVLLQSALQGIYSAALFRYADRGDAGSGFPPALISSAFKSKS